MYVDLENIVPIDRCNFIEDNFNINDVNIELIHTSHDTTFSVGYIITYNDKSLVYVTDTGYINRKYLQKMVNKNIYIIESNHDEQMLLTGPYPHYLKQRILSDKGHLSNGATANYLEKFIGSNTKYIILAHISETNNTKKLALETTKEALAKTAYSPKIVVASQEELGEVVEV